MDHKEAGNFWNENAEAWIVLSRAGFDIYRNYLNSPAFFEILPEIKGKYGIDIGCGEGYNTRLLAQNGAKIEAIDISENFIQKAVELEAENPLNIKYQNASAIEIPFEDQTFDFAVSFMCFMDIPETELAIKEAFRVLMPGGFLQFSISHPCFDTPHRKNLRNNERKTYAIEVGDYFSNLDGRIDEWIFGSAPGELKNKFNKFKTPKFTRTLSFWLNAVINAGFTIEQVNEPYPDEKAVQEHPELQDSCVVAYFLHIRCRKP
jgi:ubiquinone/menaquinone biosynthesis C-methylase UbiE